MNRSLFSISTATTTAPGSATAGCTTPKRKRKPRPRHPFELKSRSGWHGEYCYRDGTKQRLSFATYDLAAQWLVDQKMADDEASGPLLGGPARVTLGNFLGEYAMRHSIAKQSYETEISRINHYVEAIGAPRLVVHHNEKGGRELKQETVIATLPTAFKAHRDARMALRKRTYAQMARLARMKVSDIRTSDIRELMTTGTTEGWSDSTIHKEVALLKAAFNSAVKEWGWKGLQNPCHGLKLGTSNTRFVVVIDEQMQRLVQALSECDNPQFWPMVDLAIHTTLRQDALLSLKWGQTNLETRRARVWGKGKWVDAQFPLRAVKILRAMPRGNGDEVFTMSQNAVNMAWEGVREKAQMPWLTFRDLRHVGATAYAKAGLGAYALMHLLGHTTTRMAEAYVNLASSDVLGALDTVAAELEPMTPMPATTLPGGKQKHARARKPKMYANVFHIEAVKGRMLAKRVTTCARTAPTTTWRSRPTPPRW